MLVTGPNEGSPCSAHGAQRGGRREAGLAATLLPLHSSFCASDRGCRLSSSARS